MISHDLNDVVSTASAYGELGEIHKLLGNFEQSINCMERRLEMARSVSSWSKSEGIMRVASVSRAFVVCSMSCEQPQSQRKTVGCGDEYHDGRSVDSPHLT